MVIMLATVGAVIRPVIVTSSSISPVAASRSSEPPSPRLR
jgi:hypothetical protein